MKLYLHFYMQVCFHCLMIIENLTYADALYIYKKPAAIARELKIKPQAVYQWAGVLPALRAYQLESCMRQRVTATSAEDEVAQRIRERFTPVVAL